MSENQKYNSKIHHRKSIRLQNYDYSQNGYYFITICTKNKENYFGKIKNQKMFLNKFGKIIKEYWLKIEEVHNFVKLDKFVIMPNHIHGIIIIDKNDYYNVGICQWQTPTEQQNIKNINLPKKSIPSLINHFKGAVKKLANKNNYENFTWQRNYYEHIIRNEKSLVKIQEYIICNPATWEDDDLFIL
ncbi:MAG: transposase [Candidatus Moranbacteria bacterium]|nr:transposase [Candidatus Moranbacteria bacterium]